MQGGRLFKEGFPQAHRYPPGECFMHRAFETTCAEACSSEAAWATWPRETCFSTEALTESDSSEDRFGEQAGGATYFLVTGRLLVAVVYR